MTPDPSPEDKLVSEGESAEENTFNGADEDTVNGESTPPSEASVSTEAPASSGDAKPATREKASSKEAGGDQKPRPAQATDGAQAGSARNRHRSSGKHPKAKPSSKTPTEATASKAPAKTASRKGQPSKEDKDSADKAQPQQAAHVWMREMIAQTPSWLVSMVVHLLIIITLLWVQLAPEVKDGLRNLVSLSETDSDDLDEFDDKLPEPEPFEVKPEDVASLDETVSTVEQSVAQIDDVAATAMAPDLQDFGNPVAPREGNLLRIGGDTGDGRGFNQRGGNAKARLLRKGGSKGSEAAVARGLQWLAEHQWPDGGWSFDHTQAPGCRGQCRNPGQMPEARNAATGLALLPFLGAGQTHLQGKYRKNVHAGLYFLIKRMQKNGSLSEPRGTMYSHGLASIALCEAYAMTSDRSLLPPAQGAVAFICYAQDPVGGGWRYQAPAVRGGDTSVTGWELMALTSAKMAYNVQVPPLVVNRARTFLDNVQYDGGARYGYTDSRGGSAAVTAVGLLCRMYMGWKKEEPGLKKGVEWLSAQGPSNNLYYDYYATQVMHHWEGEPWKKWNAVMRDQLVNSQAKEGHETGSWFMKEDHHGSSQGGRLYCTAMATMILEVYYRHMPIYSKRSTEEDFPID